MAKTAQKRTTKTPRKATPGPAKAPKVPRTIAAVIDAARGKKAVNLVVLDLRKSGAFTDFFVLCNGTNPRQVHAIADGIEEALEADGQRPSHVEGYGRAEWVLLDYFDFIVHVFSPSARQFYGLERLWGNATRLEFPDEG
ncbi:MAG: ribosome silencing factor [Acidobacteriota bacterium]